MSQPKLEKSSTKIYPYQSDSPLQLQGVTSATITGNQTSLSTKFYIVKGNYGSLLGNSSRSSSCGTNQSYCRHQCTIRYIPPSTQEIIDKFDAVFQATGLLKNFELQLHTDPTIVPVQQPVRRVPYHTKEKISAELSRLLKLDIIEKIDGPTTWLNPIVAVPKSSGKIRICLDMRQANKAIIRECNVIPKIEDVLTELHDAKYFSNFDLTEGYHEIKLHQSIRHIIRDFIGTKDYFMIYPAPLKVFKNKQK